MLLLGLFCSLSSVFLSYATYVFLDCLISNLCLFSLGFWNPYQNILSLVNELGITPFTNKIRSALYSTEGLEVTKFIQNMYQEVSKRFTIIHMFGWNNLLSRCWLTLCLVERNLEIGNVKKVTKHSRWLWNVLKRSEYHSAGWISSIPRSASIAYPIGNLILYSSMPWILFCVLFLYYKNLLECENLSPLGFVQFTRLSLLDRLTSLPLMAAGRSSIWLWILFFASCCFTDQNLVAMHCFFNLPKEKKNCCYTTSCGSRKKKFSMGAMSIHVI